MAKLLIRCLLILFLASSANSRFSDSDGRIKIFWDPPDSVQTLAGYNWSYTINGAVDSLTGTAPSSRTADSSVTLTRVGDWAIFKIRAISVQYDTSLWAISDTVFYSSSNLAGTIRKANSQLGIRGAVVSCYNSSGQIVARDTTDIAGGYSFGGLLPGIYTIRASKTEPGRDSIAVNVGDCLKIRRHLGNVERFISGYQYLAADADSNCQVNLSDITRIRQYVAYQNTLAGGNWTFVDSAYAISAYNWCSAPRSINVNFNANRSNVSFVGVRIGDVNGSWVQSGQIGLSAEGAAQSDATPISDYPNTAAPRKQISDNLAHNTISTNTALSVLPVSNPITLIPWKDWHVALLNNRRL